MLQDTKHKISTILLWRDIMWIKKEQEEMYSVVLKTIYVENCSLKEVQGCFKCFEGLCIIHKEPKKMAFYKQVSHKVINSFL